MQEAEYIHYPEHLVSLPIWIINFLIILEVLLTYSPGVEGEKYGLPGTN